MSYIFDHHKYNTHGGRSMGQNGTCNATGKSLSSNAKPSAFSPEVQGDQHTCDTLATPQSRYQKRILLFLAKKPP